MEIVEVQCTLRFFHSILLGSVLFVLVLVFTPEGTTPDQAGILFACLLASCISIFNANPSAYSTYRGSSHCGLITLFSPSDSMSSPSSTSPLQTYPIAA